ncbi:MAG: iron uptake porin [Tolypothrix brevis GSE-NOS-MK-07-07A]|nr:iron uptake porin [Tolypothrix brevis GSE-NOS-MK-07-07A]
MEIQLLPESYNIQAPPSHREFSGEEKINPQLVNSSPQKITITPCIDKELTCKFSQASDIYPSQPSVHQLSDIQPTDWAYLAIKSLIERHQLQLDIYFGNKLDGTRTLTRYEFAAITNDVISKISPKISASNSSNSQIYLTQSELQALQKIQTEFNSELSNLNNRIDKLERRVSENISQFSSTTKFTGEALFAVSAAATNENQQGNLTFGYRTRLNFNSSFTGKDSLRIRLQARNLPRFDDITDTDMARLSYQGGDNNNRIEISRLDYSFPINKQLQIKVPVVGGSLRDFTDPLNPYLAGSSRGAISRFAQRNPIYRHGRGSGIGFSYEISDALEFEAGFLARDANNPETGFTKGAYGAIAQITIEPVEDMEFAFSYIRSYNNIDTGTGSEAANDPFDDNSNAVLANSFGIQSAIKISPNFTLAGWIGYTNATALDLPNNPNANILNWAITLAFPDLGGKGNLAGFVIGQPPKVIDSDFIDDDNNKISDLEPDTSLHLEGFYRWQVQENIGISLGLLTIINPEHNSENNTVYVGSLRTTFSF